MNDEFVQSVIALQGLGWVVQKRQQRARLPQECIERFPWLPSNVIDLVTGFDAIVAPSQQAWLITYPELSGESDSAFSWDQWEQDSLSVAAGDPVWQESIRSFWDEHFPILLSVKSGYAYAAVRKDLSIVAGEEPEFEETEEIAEDFSRFLRLLVTADSNLSRWI